MAVAQALSPWPAATATVARAAAVARLRAAVEGRAAESDEDASALGELAAARVERDAPGAPQSIRDEAGDPVCRIHGRGGLRQHSQRVHRPARYRIRVEPCERVAKLRGGGAALPVEDPTGRGDRVKLWPWSKREPEVRQSIPFTDAVVAALTAQAAGTATRGPFGYRCSRSRVCALHAGILGGEALRPRCRRSRRGVWR